MDGWMDAGEGGESEEEEEGEEAQALRQLEGDTALAGVAALAAEEATRQAQARMEAQQVRYRLIGLHCTLMACSPAHPRPHIRICTFGFQTRCVLAGAAAHGAG